MDMKHQLMVKKYKCIYLYYYFLQTQLLSNVEARRQAGAQQRPVGSRKCKSSKKMLLDQTR